MKVCLYFESQKMLKQSGIGRAQLHQKKALELNGVSYTTSLKEDYDVLHINTLFFKSYRVLKKHIKQGKKVVLHGHSTIEDFMWSFRHWKLIHPFYKRMILKCYKKANVIITPTPYSKNLIENYKGVTAKVYALSNGIDLEEYKYNEENVEKFKTYFNITNQKVVIGVGLLFERKGLLDFIEVAKQTPNVTFIWFGHLNKSMCERKILKAIKNKPSNMIMPGYISGDIIKGAFSSANALLFATLEETEGIVVLEALASRLPVIIRNHKVFEPWLEDKVNCFKGSNIEDFKNIINNVIDNKPLGIIENGYKVVEERSIDKVGVQLVDIYKQI